MALPLWVPGPTVRYSCPYETFSMKEGPLSPLELWLPFLYKCLHTFTHILGVEHYSNVLMFNIQAFLQ